LGRVGYLFRALRAPGEERYRLVERAARRIHPEAILSERARSWLTDKEFRATYDRFQPQNSRRMDRLYALAQLARVAARLPGDTAECGTYLGAASFFICQQIRGTGKLHHGFDSFEGISEPSRADGSFWHKGDLRATEEQARANLAAFDFVRLYKGWIPDRFKEVADREFALVHIDVDLAVPTRASLEFFWPRLVEGGIAVFDDYGFLTCPGARQTIDEYFGDRPELVIELPTGQGIAWKGAPEHSLG
jgi:predicted O-methyltransferase YrrM